ncbi:MAG: hypothetical protein HOP31_02975, partial [Ignavibacteria bacterium]|nr:hypothetical protein [Ignavibacteria bacterium]
MFRSKIKILSIIAVFTIGSWFIQGCGEDSVTTQADNVDFSSMSTGDSIGGDIGILVLDTVKILIKDIKLNVANINQDSTNFKVGPYVLYLNMASSVNIVSTAYIPPGTYDKVKFEIHKLADTETPPDPDFVDVNGRYSVVVKGRYNGISFVFKSNKSAHQKLTFPGNLQVSASGKSNITLQVKPYIWFIKNGLYLDPTDPVNES